VAYTEHHFQDVKHVGVAWDKDTKRVWVCLNGVALLRAKVQGDSTLMIEFYDPDFLRSQEE